MAEDVPVRSRSIGARIALSIAVVAFALAVGSEFLSTSTNPGTARDASSSFDTEGEGTRAYADLLHKYGYNVERQVGSIASATPDTASTMMLLGAGTLSYDDAAVLLDFVIDGGRLVIGDSNPSYLDQLRDRPPVWSAPGRASWQVDSNVAFGEVRELRTAREGRWSDPGTSLVVVGEERAALLSHEAVGRGTIEFLADASLLSNDLIQQRDNAAFAVDLAGSRNTVIFAEGVHGYDSASGWSAIPGRWKTAVLLLVLAALLFGWSRGMRFGQPDQQERELPPPRGVYIDSLAASMERAHDTEAEARALDRLADSTTSSTFTAQGDRSQ